MSGLGGEVEALEELEGGVLALGGSWTGDGIKVMVGPPPPPPRLPPPTTTTSTHRGLTRKQGEILKRLKSIWS